MLILVNIKLRNGKRLSVVGWFLDHFEAITQTMSDWPQATRVKARCLHRRRSRLLKGGVRG